MLEFRVSHQFVPCLDLNSQVVLEVVWAYNLMACIMDK